jgi:transposase InsO family protein
VGQFKRLLTAKGFVYQIAVIDWRSRRVLSWRLSNTMDTAFCIDALEEAITRNGASAIFNTEQREPVHQRRLYGNSEIKQYRYQHG